MNAMSRFPWKLIGYALFALFVIGAANHYAGYIPFTPQWSAKRAVAKVERLEGEVASLEATATGNAEIGRATGTLHTQTVIVREITASAETEARSAPDATTPLTDERAARLRAADKRLCDATGLCGPAPDAS